MYAGGAGAILPNKITSKHNIRYVPNMKGPDLVEKIKKQLVKNGYPDVDVKLIGDVPWRVGKLTGDMPKAQARALDIMQVPYSTPKELENDDGRLLARVPLRRRRPGADADLRRRRRLSAATRTRQTSSTSSRAPERCTAWRVPRR